MDTTWCFVCGSSVNDADIYLSCGETRYSKTTYPTKISQLIGDDFMVVVSKEDQICQRCTNLLDVFDQLEIDLLEIKSNIIGFLSEKYNLSSGGSIEYVSEELEYSKEISDLKEKDDLEVSFVQTMESVSPFEENQHLSPLSGKEDKPNNSAPFKMFEVPMEDLDCSLVKSETFRHCWTDQSLKAVTKANVSNNLSKCFTEFKDFPTILSVTETDLYSNEKLPIISPVSKLNLGTFQDGHTLQEVKKEKDSLEHCNDNINISTDVQPSITVIEKFKFENTPDSYKEFECGKNNKDSNLTNYKLLIKTPLSHPDEASFNESYSDSGLLKTEAKRTPRFGIASKNKHVTHFTTNHKKRLRPILPKTNTYALASKLPELDYMMKNVVDSVLETNLRSKEFDRRKSKQDGDFENKCSKDVPLRNEDEHSKSVLIHNIKEEAVQDKFSADYRCKLCKKEFENLAMLKGHVKQHSINKTSYSCCLCSKTFKSSSGLYRHNAANHTMTFKFFCEICGKGFTEQSIWKEHHSRHTKQCVKVCDICGKKFNSRGTYWIHRKWHFDPLPYRCSDCGQPFKHSSNLSNHKKCKHSDERPFKCPYCNLTFNVSGTFKRHLITHTKNYPFNCDVCKRGYTTRIRYKEHMVKAHSIVVDKPIVKKKYYKVAVYDDDANLIDDTPVPDSVVGSLSRDLDINLPCISDNLTEHNIITLPGN